MLLQRLSEYADRLALPPRLYSEQPVRYIVELDSSGKLLSDELTDTADPASRRTRRGAPRRVPLVQRTAAVRPLLLADKADYVFGFVRPDAKPERVRACHEAFVDLVDRCATDTGDARVEAVRAFLRADPLAQIQIDDRMDAGATITFRVGDVFPVDLPSVQSFWASQYDAGGRDAPTMQCLICRKERPVLERLELKVKGVPGGQTSGTSIIGMNSDAFESYGLPASLNAPTCETCGERFTKALNDLLQDEARRIRFENLVYVFWTREPEAEFSFGPMVTQPTAAQVKELYESVFKARQGAGRAVGDASRFYATALSGSGGRAVVRDWIDTTVGEAKGSLARWFALQRITAGAEIADPLSLRQLAYATVRTGDRNNPPPASVTRSLLRTALTGGPLPYDLLYQAVRRNRAEQSVTRQRAALIKMVLLSRRRDFEEEEMVELNPEEQSAAYRCGRLLAVIEAIQRAAMPGVNQTIVDRFYGTASSAPASVFGRLMRGAQPHLSKLERDRRGAWVALQRRLEEVTDGLQTFPKTLTLEEQGIFGLGYYHERHRRWAGQKSDAAPDADTDTTDETEE
jgi:CRISPR-associated protein Csd1